ncbi:MAG: acetylxylan esterase, partial [Bacteroidaceae bacterium]|nr:acetylxylan esterase [Bacteroidaceae bacterium]
MRRNIFLALFVCLAQSVFGETIWSGEKAFSPSWGEWEAIANEKFSEAEVGDFIVLNVKDVTVSAECQWPQIQLNNGNWSKLACAGNAALTATSSSATYGITIAMLAELKEGGLIVCGAGYTLTSVELEKGAGSAGYENAVWIGKSVIDWNTGTSATIDKSSFVNAKVGDILRIKFSDLESGAAGHICTGDWKDMPDATDYVSLSGKYYEYTITAAMLEKLQENGMIVTGVGYTLTSIDVFDPASLPKFNTAITIDDADWVWEKGTVPYFTLKIKNTGTSAATAKIEVAVETDKREAVMTYTNSKSIAAAASADATVTLSDIKTSGFYVVTATVNDELVKSFNIGYDPTGIVAAPDSKSDFEEFWNGAKEKLAAVAMDYKLTEITEKSTAKRKVYLLEMKSIDNGDGAPVTVRGYYVEPVAAGKYPCCIHFQGYDNRIEGEEPWCMGGDDHDGWCDLIFFNRGQYLNNKHHSPEDDIYGDYFAYNFGDRDKYYYRGAYLDCVRAIDFVCSRDAVDQSNLFAQGGSQGGAFTIAAAALSGKFRAIAPSIQFMGDFPNYFQVG